MSALVVTGAPLLRLTPARSQARGYRAVRLLHRAGLVADERMEKARARYGSADYRAATGIMRQVLSRVVRESCEEELDAISCPVTMVWGDDDATAPLAIAEAAVARLRSGPAGDAAELIVCPHAGHLLPLTAPVALREVLERHLT